MKLALVLFFGWALCAQTTLPTLPVVNNVTTPTVNCVLEFLDAGGLAVECTASDGVVKSRAIIEPSDIGAVAGHGEILILYFIEGGKNRVNVGANNKIALDGYAPAVTAKRRWRIFR